MICLHIRKFPTIAETGTSFEENAILKAVAASSRIARAGGCRRFRAGGRCSRWRAGNLLRALCRHERDQQGKDRQVIAGACTSSRCEGRNVSARFRCVLALARNGELLGIFEGIVDGQIVDRPRGSHGFGYDPIFVPNGFQGDFWRARAREKKSIEPQGSRLGKITRLLKLASPANRRLTAPVV